MPPQQPEQPVSQAAPQSHSLSAGGHSTQTTIGVALVCVADQNGEWEGESTEKMFTTSVWILYVCM